MKIAITGSSGLIGTALVTRCHSMGYQVVRLVRRPPRGDEEVQWDPAAGSLNPATLAGVHAVVNLAGAGVGDKRWTEEFKKVLVDSRVDSTRTVVNAMLAMEQPPAVLVSASAQGFYGDRGDEVLTEDSARGDGFLADLCRDWEGEARRAAEESNGRIRVVLPRNGLVMSARGGAFGKIMPLLKLGLAGPLGNGKQWWSWITLEDEVAAIEHLIASDVSGPVNMCAPAPARQGEVMKALGQAFGRPTLLPAPAFALRTVLGEFSSEILGSTRMSPTILHRSGFSFRHPDIEAATIWLTHQP